MPEPWSIYASPERPVSSDRVILAEVLEAHCLDHWFLKASQIREVFRAERDWNGSDRDSTRIRSSIKRLGEIFMRGEVATFVRPVGGGKPAPLPAGHWEIDSFETRFATCTVDPAMWWDPSAPGTHWILVDGPGIKAWLEANKADAWLDEVHLPPADTNAVVAEIPQSDAPQDASVSTVPGPPVFLKLGDVVARTGLSRTGIYERMAAADFPTQRRLAGRSVVWLESEVVAWQSSRLDAGGPASVTASAGVPTP